MKNRNLAIIAGISYLIIFFAAIFANFFALETALQEPLSILGPNGMNFRFGILAFMITVLFDVLVAWALNELYKTHPLTKLSTYFRMMHAAIMGLAISALVMAQAEETAAAISQQLDLFNTIWLIGLFFFGFHLILLAQILSKPKLISLAIFIAGIMYMLDTMAHFSLPNYQEHAELFLMLVAIPSIIGEMSFTFYLLVKGGKEYEKEAQ